MADVQVQVTNGEAVLKATVNIGKVYDEREHTDGKTVFCPPSVPGMLKFYRELIASASFSEMAPEAKKEILDAYEWFAFADSIGLSEAQLHIDTEGKIQGFQKDIEVVEIEDKKAPVIYCVRLFTWYYYPRRRGNLNDKREVTNDTTEYIVENLETAKDRYKSAVERFDCDTSYGNGYGFVQLTYADVDQWGHVQQGYKVVDSYKKEKSFS